MIELTDVSARIELSDVRAARACVAEGNSSVDAAISSLERTVDLILSIRYNGPIESMGAINSSLSNNGVSHEQSTPEQ
jgi:hypothetical protein